MQTKKKVVVLGGTGLIGQQFIRMLSNHPMFELVGIYASERSTGTDLKDIWRLPHTECPEEFKNLIIQNLDTLNPEDFQVCFSGLPSSIAGELEDNLRIRGKAVFSNASSHRMDEDVPILIPEINSEQIRQIELQRKRYNTEGFIITNSNCSISGVAIFLDALRKIVSFDEAFVSTYQATSGAGFAGLENKSFTDNVYPFIRSEEEKMNEEGKKILGHLTDELRIDPYPVKIIAQCLRVPVIEGHTATITIPLKFNGTKEDIINALRNYNSPLQLTTHTVAPRNPIIVFNEEDRPQPILDSYIGTPNPAKGMGVGVGRIRYQDGYLKAIVLAHNTIRGGAGGSILNAELAVIQGYI